MTTEQATALRELLEVLNSDRRDEFHDALSMSPQAGGETEILNLSLDLVAIERVIELTAQIGG